MFTVTFVSSNFVRSAQSSTCNERYSGMEPEVWIWNSRRDTRGSEAARSAIRSAVEGGSSKESDPIEAIPTDVDLLLPPLVLALHRLPFETTAVRRVQEEPGEVQRLGAIPTAAVTVGVAEHAAGLVDRGVLRRPFGSRALRRRLPPSEVGVPFFAAPLRSPAACTPSWPYTYPPPRRAWSGERRIEIPLQPLDR